MPRWTATCPDCGRQNETTEPNEDGDLILECSNERCDSQHVLKSDDDNVTEVDDECTCAAVFLASAWHEKSCPLHTEAMK